MTLLGQTREDLPFTVCSQFKPTVLEGQRCYSLDLNFLNNYKSNTGKVNGLLITLDQGTFDHGPNTEAEPSNVKKIVSLNLEPSGRDENSARIYLNTLAGFTDFRAGSFALSSLKKMTGTSKFMGLPHDSKDCQIEAFEDCTAERYLEKVQKLCGCLPWAIRSTSKMVRGLPTRWGSPVDNRNSTN